MTTGLKAYLNAIGMTCHGFVHGIIQNFRSQMMKRPIISATNIHAWALADRLKAFKHFNFCRRIGRVIGFKQTVHEHKAIDMDKGGLTYHNIWYCEASRLDQKYKNPREFISEVLQLRGVSD